MYIRGKRFSVTMPRKHYNYAHELFLYRRLVCYAYAGQALLNTTSCHLEVLIAAMLVNTLIILILCKLEKIISECISTRLWMKDLFSGCVYQYVRMYVHAYVCLVTLRNVNLRSCSECQFALTFRNSGVHYTRTLGQHFLATEDGENSNPGPSQCTYLAESSAETSAVEARRARREQEQVQK